MHGCDRDFGFLPSFTLRHPTAVTDPDRPEEKLNVPRRSAAARCLSSYIRRRKLATATQPTARPGQKPRGRDCAIDICLGSGLGHRPLEQFCSSE